AGLGRRRDRGPARGALGKIDRTEGADADAGKSLASAEEIRGTCDRLRGGGRRDRRAGAQVVRARAGCAHPLRTSGLDAAVDHAVVAVVTGVNPLDLRTMKSAGRTT